MSLLEDDSVKHGTEALNDVGGHEDVNVLLKMAFRILLSHVFDGQLGEVKGYLGRGEVGRGKG